MSQPWVGTFLEDSMIIILGSYTIVSQLLKDIVKGRRQTTFSHYFLSKSADLEKQLFSFPCILQKPDHPGELKSVLTGINSAQINHYCKASWQ